MVGGVAARAVLCAAGGFSPRGDAGAVSGGRQVRFVDTGGAATVRRNRRLRRASRYSAGPAASLAGGRRQMLAPEARVRPPVAPVVRPDVFGARHRVRSVLARGLKVWVSVLVPPV